MPSKWVIVGLAALLVSCTSPGPDNKPDDKKKTEGQKKGNGPGGEDDYPLTMVGDSLDFTWDDCNGLAEVDDNTRLYSVTAANDTHVNIIRYRRKDDTTALGQVVFRRKTGQGLAITITYGPSASAEVKITSTAEEDSNGTRVSPPNLKFVSVTGANAMLKDYENVGRFFLKHPRRGRKVRTITFEGVVVDSNTPTGHGCNLTAAPFTCTVNTAGTDVESRVRIVACKDGAAPCPRPAP